MEKEELKDWKERELGLLCKIRFFLKLVFLPMSWCFILSFVQEMKSITTFIIIDCDLLSNYSSCNEMESLSAT